MSASGNPRKTLSLMDIFRQPALRTYMIIGLTALLICYTQLLERGSSSGALIAVLVAIPGLTSRWVISPALFLIVTTYLMIDPEMGFLMPIYDSFARYGPRGMYRANRDFELSDLLLAGSILVYLVAQLRLLSLTYLGMPDDPPPRRKGQPEPAAPRRPVESIDDRELFWMFGLSAFSTLLATVVWIGIARYENGARLGQDWGIEKPVARWMMFIWLLMTALIVVHAVLRVRALHRMSRQEARLMLQDMLWSETRREQERIYQWRRWYRARRGE